MKAKSVLIMTDSPNQTTGYGQVFNNVARHLTANGYDVNYVGLEHFGLPIWYMGTTDRMPEKPYKLYPRIGDNAYGFDMTEYYLRTLNPDYFITLCDIGLQNGYISPIRDSKWRGKWIAYCAYDTESWNPNFFTPAHTPDAVVAMSKFAQKVITENSGGDIKYIPHGVDTTIFKPLVREKIKESSELPKFVVGAVGRNQIRKMWSKTIEGFGKFAEGKDDVLLLMHTEPNPETPASEPRTDAGWSILDLLVKHKLNGKAKFTITNPSVTGRYQVGPKQMNVYYNMMDVFGFLTGGEGFGLPSLEAQSAGSVLATTNYTTGPELCGDHGYLVDVASKWTGSIGIEWAIANTDHYAKILEELYSNADKLKEKQKQARKFAVENYDWETKVCPMWIDLLEKV